MKGEPGRPIYNHYPGIRKAGSAVRGEREGRKRPGPYGETGARSIAKLYNDGEVQCKIRSRAKSLIARNFVREKARAHKEGRAPPPFSSGVSFFFFSPHLDE